MTLPFLYLQIHRYRKTLIDFFGYLIYQLFGSQHFYKKMLPPTENFTLRQSFPAAPDWIFTGTGFTPELKRLIYERFINLPRIPRYVLEL